VNEYALIAIGVLALLIVLALFRVRRSGRRKKRAQSVSDMEKRQAFFRSVSEKGHGHSGDGT
jgi:hypothetical protein